MTDHSPLRRGGWPAALWAGLLSLAQPGLGQVYAGAWQLGFVLFAIALAGWILVYTITWTIAPVPIAVAAVVVLEIAVIFFQIGAAVDAVRRIRRSRETIQGTWYRSTWIAAIVMLGVTVFGPHLLAADGFGWRSFSVASASNRPNLLKGDFVVADIRISGRAPDYGDMVVFVNPKQPDLDYLKRVVGLPGDRVQLRNGTLYLNGQPVPRSLIGPRPPSGNVEFEMYRERMPNGRTYNILQALAVHPQDDTEEFMLPAGHLFALGDDRDNSLDSRMPKEVGYVPQANIIGRVRTIYWASDLSRVLQPVE